MFPSVSLEDLDDEQFAILSNDAEWLFVEQAKLSLSGALGNNGGASKSNKPKANRPASQ